MKRHINIAPDPTWNVPLDPDSIEVKYGKRLDRIEGAIRELAQYNASHILDKINKILNANN